MVRVTGTRGSWVVLAVALALVGCGPAMQDDDSEQEPDGGMNDEQHSSELPDSKAEAAEANNRGKADWTLDICEARGWYGDGECDWFCPGTDPDCSPEPLGPEPAGRATTRPIILHHGFMGSDTNFWSFHGVADALREDGHTVVETEVPPFHAVSVRAESLAGQVDRALEQSPSGEVHIIAHSMGGLDARYLISSLGYADRVTSLTTISTPHRGTRIADAFLKLVPGLADKATDAIAELAGGTFSAVADEADLRAAMEDLTTEENDFNVENPNYDSVHYRSWAGVSSVLGIEVGGIAEACDGKVLMHEGTMDKMSELLWAAAAITAGGTDLELNDGMATVFSAKWGDFQGCIPADHLDEVGQISDDGVDRYTGFDHIRFYRNMAFNLAELER